MAITKSRMQNLRGNFGQFDKTKALPGEFQIVVGDDPSVPSGKAVYMCFAAGDVRRLASIEDIEEMVLDGKFKGEDGTSVIKIIDKLESSEGLPDSAEIGDSYIIGLNVWVYTENGFKDLGPIKGPKGDKGDSGQDGTVQFDELTDEQRTALKGDKGDPGAIFKPQIDSSGKLNWSNDAGLPNPPSVNIKGPAGSDGVGIKNIKRAEQYEIEDGIKIKFNQQSATESATYDYVQIYYQDKNGKLKSSKKFGGTSSFGAKEIVIPSKTFWLYWHTDTSNEKYYGFSIDAINGEIADAGTENSEFTEVSSLPSYPEIEVSGDTYPESPNHGSYGNNINMLWKYTYNGESGILDKDGDVYKITLTNNSVYYFIVPSGPKLGFFSNSDTISFLDPSTYYTAQKITETLSGKLTAFSIAFIQCSVNIEGTKYEHSECKILNGVSTAEWNVTPQSGNTANIKRTVNIRMQMDGTVKIACSYSGTIENYTDSINVEIAVISPPLSFDN